jgi:hypothetical protein
MYLIALVPALLVYVAAAMSGTKGGLYWAALVGIGIGFFGPATFLLMDVGAVVIATWLAHQTLDLKGRPVRDRSVDDWPLNPQNREPHSRSLPTQERTSGSAPVFGPARWSNETQKQRSVPATGGGAVESERGTTFRYFYDDNGYPPITHESRLAYQRQNERFRIGFSNIFPEADFSTENIEKRQPGWEEWELEDVVFKNQMSIRGSAHVAQKKRELAEKRKAGAK